MNNASLYKIFNLEENATLDELRSAYNSLKAIYSEERFLPGEKGNEAANKLTELESSYKILEGEFINVAATQINNTVASVDFAAIARLIEVGNYNAAQTMLDDITYHTAEWHYTQAMLYYIRDWILESKTQLEMALSKEPFNHKYLTALERLRFILGNPNTNPQDLGNHQIDSQQPFGRRSGAARLCGPCAQCCALNACMMCMCSGGGCLGGGGC